jgi:tight adherence protein B
MRAGEFLCLQIAVAGVAGLVAQVALRSQFGRLLPAVAAAALGYIAPLVWLRLKRSRRLAQFERELPENLDLIAGSLRAGYGISHGLELVAREKPGPSGDEFGQVLQELNLGADLDEALARLVERVGGEDARLLATAVAIQRRTGGNLVEVLDQMSGVVRERLRLRNDVRVITTAPRVSGYFVALLPVFVVVMMAFTSPYYVQMLYTEPLGRVLAGFSGVLTLIGLFLNSRIARVEL